MANSIHNSNIDAMQHEVNEIIGVYIRIQRVCQQFGRIYGKQLLLSITGIAGYNILTLFILVFIWNYIIISWGLVVAFFLVTINTIDFWLVIAACELMVQTTREMAQLLRCFNNFAQLKVEFERELEIFALVCATNSPNFRLCGLVDLNYSTGVKIVLTMILYIIYLVQLYY
ncbi:gustatory receptor for bitter taste 22e-like, partial [Anastrepha ludens]|uniref:gustatory receptor for bitter taste 22e-like n=1 Tax=Anastrepha ludens TaxID=28586 RepID=UPI0023B0C8AA